METHQTTRNNIYMVDPCNIVIENGFNVRQDFDIEELTEQIALMGVLNPISVIPFNDENGVEKYRLVDGERRVRATLKAIENGADIARIKAIYLSKSSSIEELYIQQMMRNEGKRFSDYENGLLFRKIMEIGNYTQTEVAKKVSKNPGYISMCLSLLELAPDIQEKLAKNEISPSAVKTIVENTTDEQEQKFAVEEAIKNAEQKGKKKATAKDITDENITIAKDTKTVLKGLRLLLDYMADMAVKEEDQKPFEYLAGVLEDGLDLRTTLLKYYKK